jgi:hypothetical protein
VEDIMNRKLRVVSVVALLAAYVFAAQPPNREWTHYVRIGAYGLNSANVDAIVRDATSNHVYGIEVDNDIPGRYESFLDPTQKLRDIRELAEKAHSAGNKAFVYIAGTECITANADKVAHSLAKDHPDWLQRKISGEPATFTSGAAFWIAPGDEDVWVSPYATEWRKQYMERVRQIAATGIDGIYVDIPYWMTHFDGWEQTWASFDDYTVAAFRRQTGLDARRDLKLGDFEDPNFRKWIRFRIDTITGFMQEIDQNAKAVNPQIKTIPEIYPGIEEEAVRVGSDVYELYPVVDAIAHEYEFGGGDHMASARTPLDWFLYQVGMHSFRAFAAPKPTWILNYSWDGDKNVDAREAMMNLAMSQVMAGANFWDAKGHQMSSSNDMPTRTKIFEWISRYDDHIYEPRSPMDPIGVYFSPRTRDYYPDQFIASFRGVVTLLMQKHWEFQIVTPRSLSAFHGSTLVLPDVRVLEPREITELRNMMAHGQRIVVTGNGPAELSKSADVVHFPDCPGKSYLAALEKNFSATDPGMQAQFLTELKHNPEITIDAPASIATSIAIVQGRPHIYFANFTGLVGGKNAIPSAQKSIRVNVRGRQERRMKILPFLGGVTEIQGVRKGHTTVFAISSLDRGAIVWLE